MKFNYDLYRPKKFIQDAWKSNSAYFRAKDVRLTPHTKIGDADTVYKSQTAGRIPALAQRFKRKRLTLNEILPGRKRIFVRTMDDQNKVAVRVNKPVNAFSKHIPTVPPRIGTTEKFTARAIVLAREWAAVAQKNLMARRAGLSQLGLALLIIGAGAGSVHAYINRSHIERTEPPSQVTNQAATRPETPNTTEENSPQPTSAPSESTEAPAPPAPAEPQMNTPASNTAPDNQPAPSSSSPAPPAVAPPAAVPQAPAPTTTTPPPTAPSTPSAPATEPAPTTPPPSQPESPTPPSTDTGTTSTTGDTQQTTNTDTKIDTQTTPTTSQDTSPKSTNLPPKNR